MKPRSLFTIAVLGFSTLTGGAQADSTLFWTTAASAVQESQALREQVLGGYNGEVELITTDYATYITRLDAELAAGSGSIGVLGALHGDFTDYADQLVDLSTIDLGDVTLNPTFKELGKLGTSEQKYLPWNHATYLMAANKKALQYLPKGIDLNTITYDQLIAWAKALAEGTGSPKFGFPAGPKGLKHRFFQGYLLPSYTGSMVTKFRSAEAETAWGKFRELWQYTNPGSTGYGFMQEQLLTEEVWVAFDHYARLADAFNQRPNDFIAFPAPAGPAGRGFMPVLQGLGIPKTAPDVEAAKKLIAYMMKPETQIASLRAISFFPAIDIKLPAEVPPAVTLAGPAISAMTNAPDALPSLLPIGLGDLSAKFSQVYTDTFERIVLGGQDIRPVLDEQASVLRDLMKEAGAPCWAPDVRSQGACPVE
jgi:multiple sugar transport system substrate-binding protein